MEIAQWIILFIISLIVVLKSADYFTLAAEEIGLHFRIPPFIIGVTIVAIGTSLPEIVTSISSVLQGHSEIVIANVAGSNIANILFVLGMTAIVGKHLIVTKDIINIDLPIVLASTILIFITTLDGKVTYMDGIIMLLALLTYILYNIKSHRNVAAQELAELTDKKTNGLPFKYPAILLVSGVFLYFSADLTILSVVKLSEIFKIGTEIIAVSAIALGTSLPELVVSVSAARKGKVDIAVGNVMGSNIFNALGVMGIPALIGPLYVSPEMIGFTIPALIFITILYIFITMDKEISQWEGMTLVLLYVAFLGKTFGFI